MSEGRIILLEQFNKDSYTAPTFNGNPFWDPVYKVPSWNDNLSYGKDAVRYIQWNIDKHCIAGGDLPGITVKDYIGDVKMPLTLFQAWFDANGLVHRDEGEPAVIKTNGFHGPWVEFYEHGDFKGRVESVLGDGRGRTAWSHQETLPRSPADDRFAEACFTFERVPSPPRNPLIFPMP